MSVIKDLGINSFINCVLVFLSKMIFFFLPHLDFFWYYNWFLTATSELLSFLNFEKIIKKLMEWHLIFLAHANFEN